MALRTHRKTSLARLFEVFCDTVGANLSTVKFVHNGERLSGSHTCRQLRDLDQPIIVSEVGATRADSSGTLDRLIIVSEVGATHANSCATLASAVIVSDGEAQS